MAATLYPIAYQRQLVTMDALRARHEPKMHPEYARRLFAWIEAQGGEIGIGGGWRPDGGQPDLPGYAPEGRSFHQFQQFASGTIAYCAVDLVARNGNNVHRSPTWAEVPAQDSEGARAWGLHCNVGSPGSPGSEPWHMQPIEIDGWVSWVNAGRREPVADYPLPIDKPKPPPPTEDDMNFALEFPDDPDLHPGLFTPNGLPVSAELRDAYEANGGLVRVKSNHLETRQAIKNLLGPEALARYIKSQ